jgi:hypothetical protein
LSNSWKSRQSFQNEVYSKDQADGKIEINIKTYQFYYKTNRYTKMLTNIT